MAHAVIEAAEKIIDRKFKVLDKGFVRLVDYMGSDERIVSAARVSYGKGTKTFRQDKGLINYLLRNEHTSPFEQVVFTFHTKMPIFVARQWVRHRTARINEISGRYSVFEPEFYTPRPSEISFQSTDNKQGRSTEKVPAALQKKILATIDKAHKTSFASYQEMLKSDIARELARITLPLSLYTEWYWQIDLNNLFRFLRLRLDSHAQYEIRAYAQVIDRLARTVCPFAFDAFDEHQRDAVHLSRSEVKALKAIRENRPVELEEKKYAQLVKKLGFDPMTRM
jgi:thymidylate synthase (FAD)